MLGQSVIKSIGARLATAALALGIQMVKAEAAEGRSCEPRQVVVGGLINKFQEKLQAVRLVSIKAVMEVFVSHKASRTILMTNTIGVTCIVASGDTWNMSLELFGPEA